MGVLERWDRRNQRRAEELNEADPVPDRPEGRFERAYFGWQMTRIALLCAALFVVAVATLVRMVTG